MAKGATAKTKIAEKLKTLFGSTITYSLFLK